MKWPLKNKLPQIPSMGAVGDFAFRRSFYHHPGIDLYCDEGQEVQAIEDGIIAHIENFTGPNAIPPSPWWLETWSIMIEGQSGVLGYCELKPLDWVKEGVQVKEGDVIAKIIPVLKKDKGNGTTMLHFEHYKPGTISHVTWELDTVKPQELLDPRNLLERIK
jgi:murein DD-endopeptidase MepM/ murein hydrolase activator NlpD